MTAATQEQQTNKSSKGLPAFAIQADHPRNCDLLLQSIPGCRLRGTVLSSRTAIDAKTGKEVVPIDQAMALGAMPSIPGQILRVNPSTCEYEVVDPLTQEPTTLKHLEKVLRQKTGMRSSAELQGVPPHGGKLDLDRMKTLCREVLHLVEAKEAKLVKGVLPDISDVDNMPGRYLLNPGSMVPNSQPRYEDQMESWLENMQRTGG